MRLARRDYKSVPGLPTGMSREEFDAIKWWMDEGCPCCGVKPNNQEVGKRHGLTPSTVSRIRTDYYRPR